MGSVFQPYQETLYISNELSGGSRTPGTAGTVIWIDEHRSVSMDPTIANEQEAGAVGVAATSFGKYATQRQLDPTATWPARIGGPSIMLLGAICGHGTEVISGAGDPYSHVFTPSATSALTDTQTLWHGQGDSSNVLKCTNAVLSSVNFTAPNTGIATVAAGWTGKYGGRVAAPTPTIYVGSTATHKDTPILGQNIQATIYNSAGVAYTANITQFHLDLTRGIGVIPGTAATGIATPADICSGVLMVAGGFDFEVDSFGAASLVTDHENFAALGDGSHIHQFLYTDADGHTITFKLQGPMYLDSEPLTYGNEYLSGSVSFSSTNSLSLANQATPVLTNLKSITVASPMSTGYLT